MLTGKGGGGGGGGSDRTFGVLHLITVFKGISYSFVVCIEKCNYCFVIINNYVHVTVLIRYNESWKFLVLNVHCSVHIP